MTIGIGAAAPQAPASGFDDLSSTEEVFSKKDTSMLTCHSSNSAFSGGYSTLHDDVL